MSTVPAREVSGAVVRGFVSAAEKKGLLPRLLPLVSDAARSLLQDPPLHFSWTPAAIYEELLIAAGRIGGASMVRGLGHDLTYSSAGPVLRPMLKTVMTLSGGGGTAILQNLNRVIPMVYRGVTFDYEPEGGVGGTIVVRHGEPTDPMIYATWEGAFEFGSDVTGKPWKISSAAIAPDRKSARIRVRW